jgi:hypothetical protein
VNIIDNPENIIDICVNIIDNPENIIDIWNKLSLIIFDYHC